MTSSTRKKVEFSKLKLHSPHRHYRADREGVVGLDTESLLSGYAFLITDSINSHKWIRSADDVLSFLTNPAYRRSYNCFWNLDFDVTVLLKWLGFEFVKQLIANGNAYYGRYNIRYIPKRYLQIRDGNVFYTFFDSAQYFIPRSLNGASKAYLNDSKAHMGSKEFTESSYDSEQILHYCMKDSKLCMRLTHLLLSDLRRIGFNPTTLSSPASIMEGALVGAVHIPDITEIPLQALEYAYESYHGGWMECFRRGHFGHLYDYDISSAYPYQVSHLMDLSRGRWIHSKSVLEDATYGFVRCVVTIVSRVSPIIFMGDVNYTPIGTWQTYLTLDEVRFIRGWKLGRVVVLDGWYFMADNSAAEPFQFRMRQLFRMKSVVRNRWLPKVLSVALYGKFAQKFEDGMTGNLFNPVYASTITSRTRLQIASCVLNSDTSSLVMVSADGLTLSSPLSRELLSSGFGGLRRVHIGEGVVVGTNVMTLKGRERTGAWRPGRFDWFKLLSDTTSYSLNNFRYTTLAEGVLFDRWDEVGCFASFGYEFNVNFDHKRLFGRVGRGSDLLTNQYGSVPWEVSIPERRRDVLWVVQ